MPGIFSVIDSEMKRCFSGKRLETFVTGVPSGVVMDKTDWVQSKPISFPDKDSTCFIKGKFDTVVKFDDGSYGVIDFKTSAIKPEYVSLYGWQLHAYAYALENPAPGHLLLAPISRLGLIVYEPGVFLSDKIDSAMLRGKLSWLEITREDKAFLEFIREIISVLEQSVAPGGSPSCEWCNYRDTSKRTGL